MDDTFKVMYNTPERGIFALLDPVAMEGRLYCSTDVLDALRRFIRDARRSGEDIKNTQFRYCDFSDDPSHMVIYWNRLIGEGYKMLGNHPPTYKPVIRTQHFNLRLKAFVLLRSRGNFYTTCGIFETIEEAKEFIKDYLSGEYPTHICANNELTKQFFTN